MDQVENERNIKADRTFKLPPIIQAAAARPKNRSVDESEENLLRGKKARKFEQEKPTRIFEQKSPVRTVKPEARSPRKDVSFYGPEKKDGKIQLKPLEGKRRKGEKSDNYLENSNSSLELDKNLYIVDSHGDGRREKREKVKTKRLPKPENPQKSGLPVVGSSVSHSDADVSTSHQDSSNVKETASLELQKNQLTVDEKASKETKKPKHPEYSGAHGLYSKGSKPLSVFEGDMVAVRVPEKLYIKGQPCLGKVTSLADHQGLLTVHYFTGNYGGRWRPMMSRTSPYLRKVAADNVLCKFKLTTDGRMSPITQKKLRTIVDDQRNETVTPTEAEFWK